MGILQKLRAKPRWLLFFLYKKECIYEMQCSGAWRLLGYVSIYLSDRKIKEGWEIVLFFKEDEKSYKIREGDFIDTDKPSPALAEFVNAYEDGYTSKFFLEEVMIDRRTNRIVENPPIEEMMEYSSDIEARLRDLEEGIEKKKTPIDIISDIFVEEG